MYGQLLAGPNHRTLTLIINPDIRSDRLYGQFSLDKTVTLQAGSTVLKGLNVIACCPRDLDFGRRNMGTADIASGRFLTNTRRAASEGNLRSAMPS